MELDPKIIEARELAKPESTDPTCARFAEARADQSWRDVPGNNAFLEDGLHNDTDSCREIHTEKPIHRKFADMAAAGYRVSEIARETGFTAQWVSQVLKQPFARERVISEIKKNVQAEIKEFLEAEVLPSLRMLKSVRDADDTKKSDKIVASNSLLDRFLGKPTQPISPNVKPPSEQSDEELRAQVAAELAASQPN